MNEQKQTTCKRCGRKLRNPQAIELGMGSVCWKKSALSSKEQGMSRSARASAKASRRLPGERIRITISSGRQGRKAPSPSVTG